MKSAQTGSTELPRAACANSKPARPGISSGRQNSVKSSRWSGVSPFCLAALPVLEAAGEVDAPGVVVHGDDPRGAPALCLEGPESVPGADIEHVRPRRSGSPSRRIRASTGLPGVTTPPPRSIEWYQEIPAAFSRKPELRA